MKVYVKLAAQSGAVPATEATLIKAVSGYGSTEGKRIDERRVRTRKGHKKAQHVSISKEQAAALKKQPQTPQGRRDAVIMALLLEHGLRVGELALLQVADFDLRAGTFSFYRPKVDKIQTHRMTPDTVRALAVWLTSDAPAIGAWQRRALMLLRCATPADGLAWLCLPVTLKAPQSLMSG